MQTLAKFRYLFLLGGMLAFLPAAPVYAGTCSNPTGNESDIKYNTDYHTMQFCNGTTWMSMAGGGAGSGPMTLISTQTASASASLQFTNLPTSYNTLFLNCEGLITSIDQVGMGLVVGEGAGPTWKTATSYIVSGVQQLAGGSFTSEASPSGNLIPGVCNSNVNPTSIKLYIGNVASATRYKLASYNAGCYWSAAPGLFYFAGSGYWGGDTNPITGLQLAPGSGNIASGTCSLYGMN
jgi:hypothetical protein